ncbi:MAG: D-alanyl-D-alanine carboxypeptidase/D-alanyl-D-alanine-endopeptidase [Bacteroidota bacterium]
MLRGLLFLLCGTLVGSSVLGQANWQSVIDDWVDDDYLVHSSVGVAIADAQSGRLLAHHEGGRSLIPASNLKLLTTATALQILGPEYRFETQIAYDGYIDVEGILNGNIYIIGNGDPTLGSPEMEGVARWSQVLQQFRLAVQQAGIRQVTGRVIADDLAFSSAANGSHWQWLDMGNYYGCGAFGINAHENLYYLRFRQRAQLGASPTVARVEPNVRGLQFVNEVTSAARGSGDNAYIYGAPYTYQRYLRGTIPVGSGLFTIKGSIPDPPLFAAQQLQETLEEVGVICQRPPASLGRLEMEGPAAGARTVLHVHRSPSLAAIVKRTNMRSVNLYAEVLLRAVGLAQKGDGSAQAGLEATYEYWQSRNVPTAGVQLYDGAGMAPRNVLPPAFVTRLLSVMYQDEGQGAAFWESLPVAGRSGSLRNGLRGTAAEGRLRAKSGSLEQVRAYSGYVTRRDGQVLAFSIMLNNYEAGGAPARRKLYALMARLAE